MIVLYTGKISSPPPTPPLSERLHRVLRFSHLGSTHAQSRAGRQAAGSFLAGVVLVIPGHTTPVSGKNAAFSIPLLTADKNVEAHGTQGADMSAASPNPPHARMRTRTPYSPRRLCRNPFSTGISFRLIMHRPVSLF